MKRLSLALAVLMALCLPGIHTGLASDIPTVGMIQYAPHLSLDNCHYGFLLGLEEGGYKVGETVAIDFQNAMGDMGNSDMQAKNMVAKGEALLVGIATPAAMSAYAAAKESGVPVVFIAVSDAVAAGIVQSNEQPGGIATGVSDVLNFPAQLELIRAFLPDAKTIGVIYTVSEPNSIAQLAALTELAPGYGFTIESIGVTSHADVAGAAASLAAKGVACFNNLTDNNVVDNMSQELRAAGEANIPVFGSEVEQVINGCLAAQGIDYTELGRKAGLMAADILSGRSSPENTPVLLVNDVTPVYNSAVLAKLGLILPESFADAQDVSAKD